MDNMRAIFSSLGALCGSETCRSRVRSLRAAVSRGRGPPHVRGEVWGPYAVQRPPSWPGQSLGALCGSEKCRPQDREVCWGGVGGKNCKLGPGRGPLHWAGAGPPHGWGPMRMSSSHMPKSSPVVMNLYSVCNNDNYVLSATVHLRQVLNFIQHPLLNLLKKISRTVLITLRENCGQLG